jgi:radical SAM protein with 4Fe4S-binding SPASM domain
MTMLIEIHMIQNHSPSNLNRDDLGEVWRSHEKLDELRHRHQIPLSGFAFCEGCDYIDFCTGSCPGMSHSIVGEVNHPSPDACLRKFLAEGGRLPARALRG